MHTHAIQMHCSHSQWATYFSVRVVFAHVHAPSTWSRIVRQQHAWHGFKPRKHLLVQWKCVLHSAKTTAIQMFLSTICTPPHVRHLRPPRLVLADYTTDSITDACRHTFRICIRTQTRIRTKGDIALCSNPGLFKWLFRYVPRYMSRHLCLVLGHVRECFSGQVSSPLQKKKDMLEHGVHDNSRALHSR